MQRFCPAASRRQGKKLTDSARADEMEFSAPPNLTVRFPAQAAPTSVYTVERENLPANPQPGVVYRDAGVRITIATSIAEVANAVGGDAAGAAGAPAAPASPAPTPAE